MRPPESFIGQPVRSLQTMLRVIAQNDTNQPSLVPDGIYGNQTIGAVSAFQRNHGLPATGVTDQATWEAIVAEYEPALVIAAPAQPLEIVLDSESLRRGSDDPNIYLAQAVLTVISEAYSSVTPPGFSGILDEATAISLLSFQEMSGLPQSGALDKRTWQHLALQYPLAVRQKQTRSSREL
ncbi:MAG: hypothetical protein E7466_01375 [Ruminococcaceae bacterium]|nr:hypothetical protein [Oscillospiraceae bacterium]